MTRFYEKCLEVDDTIYRVEIYYKGTQSGFYHRAYIYANGEEIASYRVSYSNRTWESWAGQKALQNALKRCSKKVQKDLHVLIDE